MENKVREFFPYAVINKSSDSTTLLSFLDLPAEVKAFLIMKFSTKFGKLNAFELSQYVKKMRLKSDEWNIKLLEARHSKKGTITLLTKVQVTFNYAKDEICFSLPEYGFPKKASEAQVDWSVVSENKNFLLRPTPAWGEITLSYDCGIVQLVSFKPLCPYTFDLEQFAEARSHFTTEEWIDVLLGGLNFNPEGFDEEAKLTLLQRFLPNVEKRLNMIELSIKGSAKSYCYSQLSAHNWLTSGTVSRATAFYDLTRKKTGYFANSSQVVFDECQTLNCLKPDEMNSLLKTYLENGEIRVGEYCGSADAGLTLVGNIPVHDMDVEKSNMFKTLPKMLREAPLLDRFAGIIEGQKIGRFTTSREMEGWGISSDYLTEMFEVLRDEFYYRAIIDELVIPEKGADKRNTEAVKKLCTAYLKLLFPNVTSVEDIDKNEFRKYCLNPAIRMRSAVLWQLRFLDEEYEGIEMPKFTLKGE